MNNYFPVFLDKGPMPSPLTFIIVLTSKSSFTLKNLDSDLLFCQADKIYGSWEAGSPQTLFGLLSNQSILLFLSAAQSTGIHLIQVINSHMLLCNKGGQEDW